MYKFKAYSVNNQLKKRVEIYRLNSFDVPEKRLLSAFVNRSSVYASTRSS